MSPLLDEVFFHHPKPFLPLRNIISISQTRPFITFTIAIKKRNTCLIKLLFLLNLDLCQSDDPSQREGSISIEFNLPVSGQRSVHYYSCLYYCAFLRVSNVVIILLLPPNVMKETFSLALLGGVIHTTQTLLSRRKKQRSLSLICMHS